MVLPLGQAAQSPGRSTVRPSSSTSTASPVEHHQELVLAIVPVALRRPGAGLQHDMADAEVGQAAGRREAAVPAPGDLLLSNGGG